MWGGNKKALPFEIVRFHIKVSSQKPHLIYTKRGRDPPHPKTNKNNVFVCRTTLVRLNSPRTNLLRFKHMYYSIMFQNKLAIVTTCIFRYLNSGLFFHAAVVPYFDSFSLGKILLHTPHWNSCPLQWGLYKKAFHWIVSFICKRQIIFFITATEIEGTSLPPYFSLCWAAKRQTLLWFTNPRVLLMIFKTVVL